MKPIKPQPLPNRLEAALRATAGAESAWATMGLGIRDASAILAALEHAKIKGVEAEREACAAYVEEVERGCRDDKSRAVAHMLARGIRARET